MLQAAEPVGFIPSTDLEMARAFYEGVLGLRVLGRDPFALVLEAGAIAVRVVNVSGIEAFRPQRFTVFGWRVPDIRAAVMALGERGVALRRFEGMEQDDLGIWSAPGGARIAWFEDPDGNVLSLSQE